MYAFLGGHRNLDIYMFCSEFDVYKSDLNWNSHVCPQKSPTCISCYINKKVVSVFLCHATAQHSNTQPLRPFQTVSQNSLVLCTHVCAVCIRLGWGDSVMVKHPGAQYNLFIMFTSMILFLRWTFWKRLSSSRRRGLGPKLKKRHLISTKRWLIFTASHDPCHHVPSRFISGDVRSMPWMTPSRCVEWHLCARSLGRHWACAQRCLEWLDVMSWITWSHSRVDSSLQPYHVWMWKRVLSLCRREREEWKREERKRGLAAPTRAANMEETRLLHLPLESLSPEWNFQVSSLVFNYQ